MSDDDDDEYVPPASRDLNVVTANDGTAYIPAHEVVRLLRAIADSCRTLAGDPDCDLRSAAAAIDFEADNVDCMAIANTK